MRRVLIFSLNYHPFVGGAEIALKEITDRIEPEDIAFDLIAYRFDSSLPKRERIGNVTVHRIGFGKRGMTLAESFAPAMYLGKVLYVPLAAWKAWRLHRKEHFDAAWAMMTYMTFPLVLLRFAGVRVPYLLTLQEGDPFEHVFERRRIRLVKPLLVSGIWNAAAVQAISTFLLDWARQMGFAGKGIVVPNGVDLAHFSQKVPRASVRAMEERLGKQEGDVFLVTTSRLVHKNAVDVVIAALPRLPEHVHFAIFGEGPLENALRAKARALKVEARVHFMGQVPHAELPAALAACDIFVRPSRSEGMGNSFIEAMAAGLPVIATQEGGISDFLFDATRNPDKEPTGWAVDADHPEQVAQAVEAILADQKMVEKVRRTARAMVIERFGWDRVAADMQEIFGEVMEGEVMEGGENSARRILIATPLYPPEPGGPATYAKLLEDGLPAKEIAVQVLPFGDVRHLPKVLRHFSYFRKAVRAGRDADAILALDPVSTGLPAALAAMRLRKPLVLKVVGDYAWEQGKQRFGITAPLDEFVRMKRVPLRVALLRKVQTRVARKARVIIVPSEYLKGIVSAWGIDPHKITVIPNAVSLVPGGTVPEAVRELPHTRVVTVARLVPWKGIDALIDAVAEARAAGVPLALVVVGEGPERERLEAQAHERLRSGFVFTGALAPADVHATLTEANLFVLNSSYEGLSHVLIEALAAGLPIIATRAGGNAEVLGEESGVLVPVGDTAALAQALISLARDESQRAQLHAAALDRAAAFSVDTMLDRTRSLIRSVL